MSQQDASATRLYRGLILDTSALAASKLNCTNLIFVEPGAIINGQYYLDVLLMQKLLPVIHSITGDVFVFQQDNAPAHRDRDTVELLHCRTLHQSWRVASEQSWLQPVWLPHLGHDASVLSTNPRYGHLAEASCCDMGWISAQHGGLCSWSGEEDWKHVSVQKLVTLNTCCDVACLIFQLPHITTGSSQSHQCLEERNITLLRSKRFCILQGNAVTFFRCGG